MATVNDILKFVETLAPRSMKMDWDNVGLLCGSRRQEVTKVLVALDPFEGVCDVVLPGMMLVFQERSNGRRAKGALAVEFVSSNS